MPNLYEKREMFALAIEDAERRLGSYLAHDGCEKTDNYAKKQIGLINKYSEELNNLYKGDSDNECI